jgi:glycine/D-amino acid oxidase-like deaminating enzyme
MRVVVAGAGFAGLLAAYQVTHGVAARDLAAAAVTDVTGGFRRRPCWRVAGGNHPWAGESYSALTVTVADGGR